MNPQTESTNSPTSIPGEMIQRMQETHVGITKQMNHAKCPHCGAELLDEHIESNYFGCGSTEWYRPGHARYLFERGNDCYERQIAALQSELDKRKWQPIETAPLDMPLQLGWWELWPEKKWVEEISLAGHANDKGPGMSNAWLHGRATHWQPLPEPPKE